MILSIHVPKAGGNLFGALCSGFWRSDDENYGDWAGFRVPEAIERCRVRTLAMRARRDELLQKYDIIHGHFPPDKYLGLFPTEDFVAFFRDPYQQTYSHYCFLLRNPQRGASGRKDVPRSQDDAERLSGVGRLSQSANAISLQPLSTTSRWWELRRSSTGG